MESEKRNEEELMRFLRFLSVVKPSPGGLNAPRRKQQQK
jgi:hypothetical protein